MSLDLPRTIHAQVLAVLSAAALQPGARVFVFGSRASGRAKPHSDLDLAVDAGAALPAGKMAALQAAFEDSDIAIKVEVLDLHRIDEEFRQRIAPALIELPRMPQEKVHAQVD